MSGGLFRVTQTALRVPSGRALYSDLLLHDMGPALNDGFVQVSARGGDWRTTPLSDVRGL
jgi:CxxC motif-containing protein (DUF1111 family)